MGFLDGSRDEMMGLMLVSLLFLLLFMLQRCFRVNDLVTFFFFAGLEFLHPVGLSYPTIPVVALFRNIK